MTFNWYFFQRPADGVLLPLTKQRPKLERVPNTQRTSETYRPSTCVRTRGHCTPVQHLGLEKREGCGGPPFKTIRLVRFNWGFSTRGSSRHGFLRISQIMDDATLQQSHRPKHDGGPKVQFPRISKQSGLVGPSSLLPGRLAYMRSEGGTHAPREVYTGLLDHAPEDDRHSKAQRNRQRRLRNRLDHA